MLWTSIFCWGFFNWVFKGFFNPKCRTSSGSLLLKTDLQTAYRLLHHKGCGLTYISFASGIVASSHCPSLSVACSTVPVMLLTQHMTSRDAQKGQLQEKLPVDHNKAHPYKTYSIIKQTAGEALNNFFPYCSNSCSPHVSQSYKVLGMRFRKQGKKGSSPKSGWGGKESCIPQNQSFKKGKLEIIQHFKLKWVNSVLKLKVKNPY